MGEYKSCYTTDNSINKHSLDYVFEEDLFNSSYLSKHVYNKLVWILENNPFNYDTQKIVETFLFNQYKDLLNNDEKDNLISSLDLSIINNSFKDFVFHKFKIVNKYLNNLKSEFNNKEELKNNINNITKESLIKDYYLKDMLNKINIKDISSILVYTFLFIVSYDNIINEVGKKDLLSKTSTVRVLINLGQSLVRLYIKQEWSLFKKGENIEGFF